MPLVPRQPIPRIIVMLKVTRLSELKIQNWISWDYLIFAGRIYSRFVTRDAVPKGIYLTHKIRAFNDALVAQDRVNSAIFAGCAGNFSNRSTAQSFDRN
jgi:hypothetical protein